MIMKKLILTVVVTLMLLACEKEDASISVKYEVSNATSGTQIAYRNASAALISEWVEFESLQDTWSHSMMLEQGAIVYLSAMYMDSASSVKVRILVDGKIYKEGSSNNEPEKYLTVSGTIPYN